MFLSDNNDNKCMYEEKMLLHLHVVFKNLADIVLILLINNAFQDVNEFINHDYCMDTKFRKLLLIIIACSFIVAFGALFKIMKWQGATLIFNTGVVLEIIFGAAIMIYLLKNKNK
jgi:hypothetical protein